LAGGRHQGENGPLQIGVLWQTIRPDAKRIGEDNSLADKKPRSFNTEILPLKFRSKFFVDDQLMISMSGNLPVSQRADLGSQCWTETLVEFVICKFSEL